VLLVWTAFIPFAQAQSLQELYKKAVTEGVINFYGTLAQVNAEKILPVFEKKFPGIKINHVDITSDNLVARAVTEARGGKTVGDIFQAPLETAIQMHNQKLLLDVTLPEAGDYPATMKGSYWVSSNLQFIVVAWNTTSSKSRMSLDKSKIWLTRSTKAGWLPNRETMSFSWALRNTNSRAMRKPASY